MRHLIPSLSSGAFTLSPPALVHFFVLIANHLYTFHVGMNVALNPGQEGACILCSLSRTFFPNSQKTALKMRNVDLTNTNVALDVAMNPGQERACILCRDDRTILPKTAKKSLGIRNVDLNTTNVALDVAMNPG